MTRDQILDIASRRELSVHRYRWNDEKLRKKTRRMFKDGELTLVRRSRDAFIYRKAI